MHFTTIEKLKESHASPSRVVHLKNKLVERFGVWSDSEPILIALIHQLNGSDDYHWVAANDETHIPSNDDRELDVLFATAQPDQQVELYVSFAFSKKEGPAPAWVMRWAPIQSKSEASPQKQILELPDIELYSDPNETNPFSQRLFDKNGQRYKLMVPVLSNFDIDTRALLAKGLEMAISGAPKGERGELRANMSWRPLGYGDREKVKLDRVVHEGVERPDLMPLAAKQLEDLGYRVEGENPTTPIVQLSIEDIKGVGTVHKDGNIFFKDLDSLNTALKNAQSPKSVQTKE